LAPRWRRAAQVDGKHSGEGEVVVRARGAYFSIVSVLLLFLSVVAFSDNLFTDVGQPSNRDPKLIVHGLFG
jgi:hypothetical protein